MTVFANARAATSVNAEMNITPLVDVMLVLLVIFMLAVPTAQQRLPFFNASACRGACPEQSEPARLSIKRSGEMYWDGGAITHAGLKQRLANLARQAQPGSVQIQLEPTAAYALLTDVLAAAHDADVQHVSIAPVGQGSAE